MSNVGYDLDTSGGLMPLIRALIKPPDEDANGQKNKKPQHPYYKRPGKGHNHDSCDACGEGGDLICCDRCPASFHLGCYDPPLDENDIPAGLWLCKECRGSDAEKPPSARSSRAQSPVDEPSDSPLDENDIPAGLWLCKECRGSDAEKPPSARSSRAQSPVDEPRSLRNKKRSKESKEDESKEKEKEEEEKKELTPMEILVKAAKIMNPRQFELPREMRVPCLFPGTDKEGSKNGNGSVVSVDGSGCVPLPARACFVCGATCRLAPLLQCDYCPLLFHQDCLDPPLTALPTGRWMCPNHVEQYIDWKMVNSISATERVALWERFSGPVDQHAVKVDFIRRARTARPAFRVKVPVGVRGRVIVPGMVRAHYRRPAPLLPSRREYVRCQTKLQDLKTSDYDFSEEDESLPKHTICMNLDCPSYSGRGKCPHSTGEAGGDEASGPTTEDSKQDRASDSSLSDSDFEYLTSAVKRRKVSAETGKGVGLVRLELQADGEAEALLAAVDHQLEKLDHRLVKLLAWQRLQQVLVGEQCAGAWRRAGLGARAEALVRRSIDRAKLAKYGFRHVALPSELLSRRERERISETVWGSLPGAPPPAPASPGHSLSLSVVRATVCAVQRPASNGLGDGLGRPIPMRLSKLTVGSDSNCDVVLDATKCYQVSPTHATIFYDEVSRQFELINYSEWGSRVNGVLYCCDPAPPATPAPTPAPTLAPTLAPASGDTSAPALPDLASLTRLAEPKRLNGTLTTRRRDSAPRGPCTCVSAPPRAGAWEGSALVPHGALLQFGCLMFVFSITDPAVFPYEETLTESEM